MAQLIWPQFEFSWNSPVSKHSAAAAAVSLIALTIRTDLRQERNKHPQLEAREEFPIQMYMIGTFPRVGGPRRPHPRPKRIKTTLILEAEAEKSRFRIQRDQRGRVGDELDVR